MPKITAHGKTDCGLKRTHNEDAFIVRPDLPLFVVADGMGGAAAGEVASQIFTQTAIEVFDPKKDPLTCIQEIFKIANHRIYSKAKENPQYKGMGCTAEVLTFDNTYYFIGHVGDSRTYIFRNRHLHQLTHDHSFVQAQIDEGVLTKEAAKKHPWRNVILRAVGLDKMLTIDLIKGEFKKKDLFLLCSDGLSDMVDDTEIEYILNTKNLIKEKVEQLISLANKNGGHDNITVILCGFEIDET